MKRFRTFVITAIISVIAAFGAMVISILSINEKIGSSGDIGSPPPLPSPTIPVPYEDKRIADARKQVGEGKIAFKPPEEMIVGKTETLEARITHQEQSAALEEGLKGRGKPVVKTLKVSCRMKVTLTAEKDAFNITPINSSEIRLLDPNEPFSSWKWDITPLKYGDHELHLVAETIADIPKLGERSLYEKTFDYTIKVKVNKDSVLDWVAQHWEYFLGSIVIPLIGWLWVLYSKRKEKKEKEANEKKPPDPPKIILP
jgi:hypothetical protein